MENPRTIILSTHLIDEVSKIFEKIIILHRGTFLLQDEVENISSKVFHVSERKDKIEEALRNKNLLNSKLFGTSICAPVYDTLSMQ